MNDKEITYTVKRLKKYEKLSDIEKDNARDATIRLAAGIVTILGGVLSDWEFMDILAIFGSIYSSIHIKNMMEAISKKSGYDLKVEELKDQLQECGVFLEDFSSGGR